MSTNGGVWAYVALFLVVLVGAASVPALGTAAVGAAAVLASQHKLSIDTVIGVACVAAAIGGVLGYGAGHRWGLSFLERPGRFEERRRKALDQGHRAYEKWGWLACFMIPAFVAGIASMTFVTFLVFNTTAALVYQFATALPAYGAGRVGSGHSDAGSIILAIAAVALLGFIALRLIRRRRQAPADGSVSASSAGTQPALAARADVLNHSEASADRS